MLSDWVYTIGNDNTVLEFSTIELISWVLITQQGRVCCQVRGFFKHLRSTEGIAGVELPSARHCTRLFDNHLIDTAQLFKADVSAIPRFREGKLSKTRYLENSWVELSLMSQPALSPNLENHHPSFQSGIMLFPPYHWQPSPDAIASPSLGSRHSSRHAGWAPLW